MCWQVAGAGQAGSSNETKVNISVSHPHTAAPPTLDLTPLPYFLTSLPPPPQPYKCFPNFIGPFTRSGK